MGESVSGVGSSNRTQDTLDVQTDIAAKTETKNFFKNTATENNLTGAQEKTLFDQSGVTKTTLAAKTQEIPRMDAASERRLAEVDPQLANRIRLAAADLKAQGITVMVTSGYRSFAEQNALYAQGRTKPGNIVTNAKGGQSLHNYGLAVDVVPLGANGQPNWNAPKALGKKSERRAKNKVWSGAAIGRVLMIVRIFR